MTQRFFLASYPRSGNTLARLLLDHHFDVNARSSRQGALTAIGEPTKEIQRIMEVRSGAEMVCLKTHHVKVPERQRKALVLVRDGRDAMVSFTHYLQRFHANILPFEALLRRVVMERPSIKPQFPPWRDFYQYWLKEHPGEVVLVRFEDLVLNQFQVMRNALHVLYPDVEVVREEPIPTFDELHHAKPGFFRRGKVGSWRDEMPPDIEEMFWALNGEMMTGLAYKR